MPRPVARRHVARLSPCRPSRRSVPAETGRRPGFLETLGCDLAPVGGTRPDPPEDRFGAEAVFEDGAGVQDRYHLLHVSADIDLEDEDLTAGRGVIYHGAERIHSVPSTPRPGRLTPPG